MKKRLRIHVLSAYPFNSSNFAADILKAELQQGAGDPWAEWENDPAIADIILFMEHHPPTDFFFLNVFKHPLFGRFSEKCFLYHDADYAYPVVPGIYPSSEVSGANHKIASSPYFFQICENPHVTFNSDASTRSHLYSFAGAFRTHPSRRSLQCLSKDPRSMIIDTSDRNGWELPVIDQDLYHQEYANLLSNSKFVLCPRGISPCSYRLTESMKMGRAPVVISDDWNFPSWLPWRDFSIVVSQRKISNIPDLLRERETEAHAMGLKARMVWEEYLAPLSRTKSISRLLQNLNQEPQLKIKPYTAIARTVLQALESAQGRRLVMQQIKNIAKKFHVLSPA
ncbi:exostosin family protein [bacterium]|nr:exostosin family protein [bacterium]